jgi:drug/metabolite transporter (DMT)-like permease
VGLEIVVGFLLVLLGAFCFCFQNVIVRVLFSAHVIFGLFPLGGFVTPTLPHAFLLLFMRMAIVVPIMAALAPTLYPDTWAEIRQLRQAPQRSVLGQAIAAGSLMFLYLALLYISIGLIPTGVALTLFFTYPVFTALLSWKLFGISPTYSGWSIMGMVFLGSALTMPPITLDISQATVLGIATGIASGVAYAGYTVLAQQSFTRLHPVPFTWLSFVITLVFSTVCLGLGPQLHQPLPWRALWIGGALSAIATASGHLLNNFGIRRIGATAAAMVASTNPAFTVVLAWIAIQETLRPQQIAGVMVVTGSVLLLSRSYRPAKA